MNVLRRSPSGRIQSSDLITKRLSGTSQLIADDFFEPIAGNSYTLSLTTGSFSLSGFSANLLSNRLLTITTRGFSETGNTTLLLIQRRITAIVGAIAHNGQSSILLIQRKIILSVGSFLNNGVSVIILVGRKISLSAGGFIMSRNDTNVIASRILSPILGSFNIGGNSVAFSITKRFILLVGSFVENANTARLAINRYMSAVKGPFIHTGNSVNVLANRRLIVSYTPASSGGTTYSRSRTINNMRIITRCSYQKLMIMMIDSSNHIVGKTGLTLSVSISKNGSAFSTISPTIVDMGNGWYSVTLNTNDTNSAGDLAIHVTASGADPSDIVCIIKS